MARSLAVHWNRAAGGGWADLFTIDLEHPHFEGLKGVFVAWHGGEKPAAVWVGEGVLRPLMTQCREDAAVQGLRQFNVLISWAKVDDGPRPGVARFLSEALRPKVRAVTSAAEPVEVNLPGRGQDAPPDVPGPAPGLIWQDMVRQDTDPDALKVRDVVAVEPPKPAAPTPPPQTPKLKKVSRLQTAFDELIKPKAGKAGLFGGTAKPVEDKEGLVVAVVQLLMREAVFMGASDIHLEPQEQGLRVRFRVDGILEQVLFIPNDLQLRPVSHIRVACGLDPEKGVGTGRPEDGRMGVSVEGRECDLRLSTFPTSYGDKAVLRIIPREVTVPALGELGLLPSTVETLRRIIRRPQGMIVVTGPTGSGKSTTLYTMLQELNDPTRNIVTLEDPIEKKIAGISQGVLHQKTGFTFSEGLRAILRQDPNIIMVGEVRDVETAEIALSASLTGHLLFTTLHTNSALGAVTRLLDMGLEPFMIASALTAVLGQRLARRVCANCKEPSPPTDGELADLERLAKETGVAVPPGLREGLMRGTGCSECRDLGLKGRLLLFETIELTTSLRQLILQKASIDALRAQAVKEGAETMLLDGLRKAAAGMTTLSEVIRVAGAAD